MNEHAKKVSKNMSDSHLQVIDERQFNFTIIGNQVLEDVNLTAYEKIIYAVLCKFANKADKTCYPSIATIQKLAGCSKMTVIRGIKKLEELRYIIKEKRESKSKGNESNLYRIIDTTLVSKCDNPLYQNDTTLVSKCYNPCIPEIPELYPNTLKDISSLYKKNIKKSDECKKEPKYSKEAHELTIYFLTTLKEKSNYEPIQKSRWFASNHKYADELLKVYSLDEAKEIICWGLEHSFHGKNFNSLPYIERFIKEYLDAKKGGDNHGRTRTYQKPNRRPLTAEDYDEPEYRDLIEANDRKLEKRGIMPKMPPGDQELP